MFSVVIPVYNEEDNLGALINEIKTSLNTYTDFELIFVNDCSTDKSLKVLEKEKKKFDFRILNNKTNTGQSFSILSGIQNSKYDTIVTLDGDGQNNPRDIPKLIEFYYKINKACLVGGIRAKRKDNIIKIVLNVDHRKRKYGKSKYGTILRLINGIRDMIKVKKMIKKNISS